MKPVIRRYRPADKNEVLTLFSNGPQEHIRPCFYNAISSPLYLSITLGLSAGGYLLLGSVLVALVLAGGWLGLVYYCCHELYASFVRERLRTDMQDIPGNYLTMPDDCFFVAEAEVSGRSQVVAMVAVVAKQNRTEKYGELFRMIVSSSCRRVGLGARMIQTAVNFCKEHGISKVVLETSSPQIAAVALYEKTGFTHVLSHTKTQDAVWMIKLARATILLMEKHL
ncbi:N-acetyltransferase 8-like [Lampris incognitus]|uniref:N-acetyltransferase 8-like n=1 Tax=Lampris incognitus TaxID=2546036 RepID=UPI0024B562BE|nr:N-acetyltransferase 8-like [Lampris incognitus]